MPQNQESEEEGVVMTPPLSSSPSPSPLFDESTTNQSQVHGTELDAEMEINSERGESKGQVKSEARNGTLTSAKFNILSTMVGGGSLSLPLAFHQAGSGFLAPLLLALIATLVYYSIHFLICASDLSEKKKNENGGTKGNRATLNGSDQHDDDSNNEEESKGTASYESVACAAFGNHAKYFSMALISTICFFTIVGYGVLLRDMLLPLADYIFPPTPQQKLDQLSQAPTAAHNLTMIIVILLITPLCTLKDLTPLQNLGMMSMLSIFTVALCVSYRSVQCNFSPSYDDVRLMPWYEYVNYLPPSTKGGGDGDDSVSSWDNVLNALPILISVFMCHFNVVPVHNELKSPTPARVQTLYKSSLGAAYVFYMLMGFIGSMYGNCCPNSGGMVEGNVLLSFDESDGLLLVARSCLSLTITLAFPVLVVPARDTFLRAMKDFRKGGSSATAGTNDTNDDERELDEGRYSGANGNDLREPLLSSLPSLDDEFGNGDIEREGEEEETMNSNGNRGGVHSETKNDSDDKTTATTRILSSVLIFWSGAAVACAVESIDVVWDFLGGSLSLIMGFLIPSGSYLILVRHFEKKGTSSHERRHFDYDEEEEEEEANDDEEREKSEDGKALTVVAWSLIVIFIPVMFMLTGNAFYNLDHD